MLPAPLRPVVPPAIHLFLTRSCWVIHIRCPVADDVCCCCWPVAALCCNVFITAPEALASKGLLIAALAPHWRHPCVASEPKTARPLWEQPVLRKDLTQQCKNCRKSVGVYERNWWAAMGGGPIALRGWEEREGIWISTFTPSCKCGIVDLQRSERSVGTFKAYGVALFRCRYPNSFYVSSCSNIARCLSWDFWFLRIKHKLI